MGRRVLSEKCSWDDMCDYASYVEISLSLAGEEGDKEVAALAPPVKKLRDAWLALDTERRGWQWATLRANALVAMRDLKLGAVTKSLHDDALSASGLNRSAPLFKGLFPKPLSQLVPQSLGAQLGPSRVLLLKLGAADMPAALRKAHEKPLKECIAAGEAAIQGRDQARVTAQGGAVRVAVLREEINSALLVVEGGLQTIAGRRGLGKDFVAAFFPTKTAKKPADPARKSAPTPAPGPGPAPAPAGG